MDKKIFNVIACAIFVVTAVVCSVNVVSERSIPDMVLENIEALADGDETSDNKIHCCGNYGECMKVLDVEDGQEYVVVGVKFMNTPCP